MANINNGLTLLSVSEYNSATNQDTPIDVALLDVLLLQATNLINDVCKRDFRAQDYSKWYRQEYKNFNFAGNLNENMNGYANDYYNMAIRPQYNEVYGGNIIMLDNYPVNKVRCYGINNIGSISCSLINATIEITKISINLEWYDNSGVYHTNNLLYTLYPTIGSLQTAINLISGWNISIDNSYINIASIFLREMGSSISNSKISISCAIGFPARYTVENNNKLVFDNLQNETYVVYNAGYTYPIDNNDNTAILTAGNVPSALQLVCQYIVSDLFGYISGTNDSSGHSSNLLKSEQIKDYSYTRFDHYTIDRIVEKYRTILLPYINLWL